MKNFNLTTLVSAIILFSFSSCVKQMDAVPSTHVQHVNNAIDMKAGDNFNWSTTRKVNFTFEGSGAVAYDLILKVSDTDGNVIMQKLHSATETYKVTLDVPVHLKLLTVTFGADSQTMDCTTGAVSFNAN